ncbi:MAG: hypothetical protein OEY67_07130 [Gammaproteobacteria bacterium]|nr:hypothetical protein [Gammaproteobacteria bacterium]
MKRLTLTLLGLLSLNQVASAANNIDQINTLTQPLFKALVEDLGTAVTYRALTPAEPLGITGFDLGFEVTSTEMVNSSKWVGAISSGNELDNLVLPKIHLVKGLPFGINVGAFYVGSSNSNVKLTGGEISYAILKGGVASPALSVRGAMSTLSGVDELELDTQTYELSISKGFAMFTPYAGIGKVKISGSAKGASAGLFSDEDISATKTFVGLNMNFGLLNIVLDTDKTGDATTNSFKMGWRW